MRTIQVSDSQIQGWGRCEVQYYYEKVERFKLVGESNSYMDEGTLIHWMLAVFYKMAIEDPNADYASRIEKAIDAGIKKASLDDALDIQGDRLHFLRDTIFRYADYYKDETWKPVAVEQPFTITLYEGEDIETEEGIIEGLRILFEGIIDLLIVEPGSEDLIPVDHKSTSRFDKVNQASNLSGQFMGYAVSLNCQKVIENKIGLQTSYSPKQRFVRHVITFDADVMEEWKGFTIVKAQRIDQAIQHNFYIPAYDKTCNTCSFGNICYSKPSVRSWKLKKDYLKLPIRSRRTYT